MDNRYIALIPAYEPDGKLLGLIDELSVKGFDIVVVDDGSGKDYEEIFEKAEDKAIVLTHAANRGKGILAVVPKKNAPAKAFFTACGFSVIRELGGGTAFGIDL